MNNLILLEILTKYPNIKVYKPFETPIIFCGCLLDFYTLNKQLEHEKYLNLKLLNKKLKKKLLNKIKNNLTSYYMYYEKFFILAEHLYEEYKNLKYINVAGPILIDNEQIYLINKDTEELINIIVVLFLSEYAINLKFSKHTL